MASLDALREHSGFFPDSRMQWGLCAKYPNSRMLWGLCAIDFGVFLVSWGPSRKEPGCGNRFRVTSFAFPENQVRVSMGSDRFCGSKVPGSEGLEVSKVSVFDGFRRVRFCSRGLDGTGSGNRVPGTRSI